MDARPKALSSCLISTQITRLCRNFTEKVMKLESLASPGNKSLNTGLKVRKWSSSIPILCTYALTRIRLWNIISGHTKLSRFLPKSDQQKNVPIFTYESLSHTNLRYTLKSFVKRS